jgi:hypothetical protein
MHPKYLQVGLTKERLDPEHTESRLAIWIAEGEIIDDNTVLRKQKLVTLGMFLILEHYFLDDLRRCFSSMSKILEYAEEYFFGSWRDYAPTGYQHNEPPSREYQNTRCLWSSEFHSSIVWCACLGDWKRAREISEYLRDDIKLDIDQKPENRAWLLYLGGILTERPESEMDGLAVCIKDGKRKREKLLFALLQAILHGTDSELDAAAKQYLKYYKSSESKSQKLTDKVAMDGTFLMHFAKHKGREIEIPKNFEIHIIPQI